MIMVELGKEEFNERTSRNVNCPTADLAGSSVDDEHCVRNWRWSLARRTAEALSWTFDSFLIPAPPMISGFFDKELLDLVRYSEAEHEFGELICHICHGVAR